MNKTTREMLWKVSLVGVLGIVLGVCLALLALALYWMFGLAPKAQAVEMEGLLASAPLVFAFRRSRDITSMWEGVGVVSDDAAVLEEWTPYVTNPYRTSRYAVMRAIPLRLCHSKVVEIWEIPYRADGLFLTVSCSVTPTKEKARQLKVTDVGLCGLREDGFGGAGQIMLSTGQSRLMQKLVGQFGLPLYIGAEWTVREPVLVDLG